MEDRKSRYSNQPTKKSSYSHYLIYLLLISATIACIFVMAFLSIKLLNFLGNTKIPLWAGLVATVLFTLFISAIASLARLRRKNSILKQIINSHKRTEANMREREGRCSAIMSAVPDFILVLENTGRISYINRLPEGLLSHEVIGSNWVDWIDPDDQTLAKETIAKTFATRESATIELRSAGLKQRKKTWFQVNFSHMPSSLSIQVVLIVIDISIRKQTEQILFQASKLASLGIMSAGIAHEINNPLTIISGSIKLISQYKDKPEKIGPRVITIQNAIDRIVRIMDGLKKFSPISEGNNFRNHSLSAIVREALVLIEASCKAHNTIITFDLKTESPILCDEIQIEQVIINLINNSLDAVKGSAEKWIKVEVLADSEFILLRVIDSGPYIPGEIREKIFDPFFTTKTIGEGSGLGLSISKGILDEHHAAISVLPHLPNTCFEIRFQKVGLTHNGNLDLDTDLPN